MIDLLRKSCARWVRLWNSRLFLVLCSSWLVFLAAGYALPASYWFVVKHVDAGPARPFEPVPMVVVQRVNHPFEADWYVTVRKFDDDAGWQHFCGQRGASSYSPDTNLPKNLTLSWWTDQKCSVLPEGRYTVETAWYLRGAMFIPTKTVRVTSNIFEVKP